MTDRKISELTGTTTLGADDLVTIVQDGANRKMTGTAFNAAIGATGSIVQDGAITGTPVLDIAGTVNNIRNIEDGPGILSSVSPENGLKLEHNFARLGEGTPVVSDLTALSPVFKSLIGGTDITITETDNKITLSVTGSTPPVSTKTTVIQQLSDLPTAAAGVRTLAADTEYQFQNDIDIGTDRFALSADTVISGTDHSIITLTSSTTGAMLTADQVDSRVKDITLAQTNASGKLLDITCTGVSIIEFDNCDLMTQTLGDATGYQLVEFDDCDISIAVGGLSYTGTNGEFLAHNTRWNVDAGTAVDFGTATFDSIKFAISSVGLAGGTTFIDGTTASGNINANGIGTVVNTVFTSGLGTTIANISVDDARWQFALNDDIPDTRTDGLLSMQSNGVSTAITVAGTPVLVAGTWVVDRTSQMTGTTAGRLTYNGAKDAVIPITASMTVAPVSGGTVSMSGYIAINGVVVPGSQRSASASSSGGSSITMPWQVSVSTGDYVEVWVANNDGTVDILAASAVLRVN